MMKFCTPDSNRPNVIRPSQISFFKVLAVQCTQWLICVTAQIVFSPREFLKIVPMSINDTHACTQIAWLPKVTKNYSVYKLLHPPHIKNDKGK